MPTLTAEQAWEAQQPPYPTYEALQEVAQRDRSAVLATLSPSAQRLFWTLSGPLTSPTSISIMEKPHNPDSLEPYFDQSTNTFHAVSEAPLTEPKVSSITARVYELELWEEQWMDMHRNHSEPDGGEENGEGVVWGELEDYDEDLDEEGEGDDETLHLLMCCSEKRPRKKAVNITVKPATGGGKGFVTVHDYLSTVHLWLLGLRGDILAAMHMMNDGGMRELHGDGELMPTVPSSASDLMVKCNSPVWLRMCTRGVWIKEERNPPKLDFSSRSAFAR